MTTFTVRGGTPFAQHRREQLIQRAPGALITAAAMVALYNVLVVALGTHTISGQVLYAVETAIPFGGAFLLRLRAARRHVERTLLLLDMIFTTLVLSELFLPQANVAGISLALALKLAGTALVFPWAPVWQAAAAAYTLAGYTLAGMITGVMVGAGPNIIVAPLVGAMLCIVGATLVDGHRRGLYAQQVALAESEEKYRSLTEGAVAGVLVYQDDRFVFANEATARMLGYSREELIGQSHNKLYRPEDLAEAERALADLLSGQRGPFETLLRVSRRDGREVQARASFSCIQYDSRPAALGVVIDVTEERDRQREATRLAAEMCASEARYRDLFENATDLIIETDLNGYFIGANPAALALAGYAAADLQRGLHLSHLVAPDFRPTAMQFRSELLAGVAVQQPHVVPLVARDGSRHEIELYTRVIQRDGRPIYVQSIGRDVTERQRVDSERQTLLLQTQRLAAFQHALTAVAPALHGSHGLDHTSAQIAGICRDLFDVSCVYLWYREGDMLVGRGASGEWAEEFRTWSVPLFDPQALSTRAFEEKRPVYVNRIEESEWRNHPVAQVGMCAWMVIPLFDGDQILGALALLDRVNPERFDAQSAEWAQIFAAQAVLAIENARLRDRERVEARATAHLLTFAQTLHAKLGDPALRRSLAEESALLLDADITAIVIHDAEQSRFRVAHVHGIDEEQRLEIEGLEFEPQTAPVFTAEARQFSRAAAAKPLAAMMMERWGIEHVLYLPIRRDQTFLALLVFARRRELAFSDDSVRLAEGIAYHAATTLENARLLDALHAANRLKSDFVATMSHELRSPLNVIIGYTDLLRDAQFGAVTPQQTETLDRVLAQSQQLLELINATLDLSRLERGEVGLAREQFALGELFGELQAQVAPRLAKAAAAVHWQPVNGMRALHTDRGKLKLIVRNLLDNALKFTEEGRIDIAAREIDNAIEILVRDTGRGIPPESLPNIFDMFRQVDSADSRTHGGVGLGLYIVRRLAEMLGGTVGVESQVGVGSTFRVSVPRQLREPLRAAESAPSA